MDYSYKTQGTCCQRIDFTMDGDKVVEVKFHGGCAGNTQGVAALVKGMTKDEVIEKLQGIKCGFKPTSCPDQLAKALQKI